MNSVKVLLASTSPRRRELILNLGLPVEIIENNVDETINQPLAPEKVVQILAERKLWGAREKTKSSEGIIVAGDTVVVHHETILGKPKNTEDAVQMLTMLQGDTHTVYSGLACLNLKTGKQLVDFSFTKVMMKSLNESQIRNYVNTGEPMDKAGAYAIQGIGATIVEKIEGDYFTVVGLPLSLLADLLSRLGVEIL